MIAKSPPIIRGIQCSKCSTDAWRRKIDKEGRSRGHYCIRCVRDKSRRWVLANKDRARATRRRHYEKNPQIHRDKAKAWRERNPERRRANSQRWKANNQPRALWQGAKQRAALSGLPFSITPADIVIPSHCPVFGTPLALTTDRAKYDSPSVDRLIPELGYVPGNITVISWRANFLKRDASPTELRRLADWVAERVALMGSVA